MIATQRFRKLVFLVDLIVYTLPYYIYPTALCQVKYNLCPVKPLLYFESAISHSVPEAYCVFSNIQP